MHQWLSHWDSYNFEEVSRQRKPLPYFYMCSMSASLLRRLAGVRRRQATGPRASDIGIQRGHDRNRSIEIRRYVEAGYPWASLNTSQREQFPNLQKPGWLPTAVVANLLSVTTERDGVKVAPQDLITFENEDGALARLVLPDGSEDPSWRPAADGLEPIEIIDGQHRLYAFSESEEDPYGDFELPIVVFVDLDISWQAYLFWSINIKPTRITPSLAYDLYPLLRTLQWLEYVEGPMAYRITRAQELTEALWSHPQSPWLDRISMLRREKAKVTQAAFVRSLTLSFVRAWSARGKTNMGGFFGTHKSGEQTDVLRWSRPQQAAYLIVIWISLREAIANSDAEWAAYLRARAKPQIVPQDHDPAFAGRYSILASDQGVRGVLQVCNDISYQRRHDIDFRGWRRSISAAGTDHEEVTAAIEDLRKQTEICDFIESLTRDMADFDWRSAVTPGLPIDIESFQSRYRSGSGYKQVRLQLLLHLADGDSENAASAHAVAQVLGYVEE